MVNKKMMSVTLVVTAIVVLLLLLVANSKKSATTTNRVDVKIVDPKSDDGKQGTITNEMVELAKTPIDPHSEEFAEYVSIAHAKACQVGGNPDEIVLTSADVQGENIIITFLHRSLASPKKETISADTRYPKGEGELTSKAATLWGATITIDTKTKAVIRID